MIRNDRYTSYCHLILAVILAQSMGIVMYKAAMNCLLLVKCSTLYLKFQVLLLLLTLIVEYLVSITCVSV